MQGVDQTIDGRRRVLFGGLSELGVERGGGGTGVPEQALDMSKTQALFEQVRGKAVAQRMDRDFFLIPHCLPTAFIAAWVPPRSIGVVARQMRSGVPTALGNNQRGLRCLRHKARNAR